VLLSPPTIVLTRSSVGVPYMADLESVIVGSAVAIAGSLASQLLLEYLKQRTEKKKRKEDKLQDLLSALYEYQNEVGKEESTNLFAKVQALTVMHFQQFDAVIIPLAEAAFKYETSLLERDEQIRQGIPSRIDLDVVRDNFNGSFLRAISTIIKYSQHEFQ
jgi:hypothetical protein